MKRNLIIILGPTASGKTALAVRLASELHGEIISADSRQVYRGMDIGTGKDLSEYVTPAGAVSYHLIDIADPADEFNVYAFQKQCREAFDGICRRNALPILVGGTGLYIESFINGYDLPEARPDEALRLKLAQAPLSELQAMLLSMNAELHNRTDLDDRERLIRKIEIEKARQNRPHPESQQNDFNAVIFGIYWERDILRQRIAKRLRQRLEQGMIEEVRQLHLGGISWERLDRFGLEYRYIARYLQNFISQEEMTAKLEIAIGQFAKRQMTWFRRMERKGMTIEWIPGDDYARLQKKVFERLS